MSETKDEIIDRLINEACHTRQNIDQAERALSRDSRFQGLTLVGGIKAVIQTLHEVEVELRELNQSLDIDTKARIKKMRL